MNCILDRTNCGCCLELQEDIEDQRTSVIRTHISKAITHPDFLAGLGLNKTSSPAVVFSAIDKMMWKIDSTTGP